MRLSRFFILAALALVVPLSAIADPLVPTRRLQLSSNTDLPGGDLSSIFDTTFSACERACLATQACEAMVFNTRNNSCFLKAGRLTPQTFQGAWAGIVTTAAPGAEERAVGRRAELGFLGDGDISTATAQAGGMAGRYTTNGYSAADHMAAAHAAEKAKNYRSAYRFAGAATVVSDRAGDWAEFARLLLVAADHDDTNADSLRRSALSAAINAYLRSSAKAEEHTILVVLGKALEANDRGRDEVKALRLAQDILPRESTATLLSDAIAKYGFRITGNDVSADSARPRICATFSENLDKGADYSSFVQLPQPGFSVAIDGTRRICVEGVKHGERYRLIFRAGLPAADGQKLVKSVPITQYVRDRSPGVRFAGRGYVLPRIGKATLPVTTVNTKTLDLALYRVSDRNVLRAIQNDFFGQPVQDYQEWDLQNQIGAQIWSGSAEVAQKTNEDVTTRLDLSDALKGEAAGIYVLRAAVPGVDTYATPPAWQWFAVSDLGLVTYSGVDGLNVVVRALGDAGPKPGVTVQLLSNANEVLGTTTTDAEGLAHFAAGLTRGTGGAAPALVTAREGTGARADLAFLSLKDPEFDLSDRGVTGRAPAGPIDVYLTTDRGAYRAGETVHVVALARDATAQAVGQLPLTAVLERPDGVEYSRTLAQDIGAGGHVFDLPIQQNAPRGSWRLALYADLKAPPVASQTFLVADFLPERIDFKLSLPDAPIHLGDVPSLGIDARYLFGAPGADLSIEGEVQLSQADRVEGLPGYVWGHHDAPFSAKTASFDPASTNAKGHASVAAALPRVEDPMRPLQARFTVRVAEGSGRPVERQIMKAVAPSAPLIGLKPQFDGVVPENGEAAFQVQAVGPDLKPAAMQAQWKLVRIETVYQWYQQNGSWFWEPVTTRTPVADGDGGAGRRGAGENFRAGEMGRI